MKNIQVVERTFRILELAAQKESGPCTLSELVAASKLKPPTAARIARTLTALGYLEQLGRRKGYVLGRMAYNLTRGQNYMSPLVKAAKPLMQQFSNQTGEYICISGLRDGLRVIFAHILSTQPVQVTAPIEYSETPYRSASGHLLLAYLPRAEQEDFFNRNGIPGAYWPTIRNKQDFLEELARIREDGRILDSRTDMTSIAVPVINHGQMLAAIGVFLPTYRFKDEQRKLILHLLNTIPDSIVRDCFSPQESDIAPGSL